MMDKEITCFFTGKKVQLWAERWTVADEEAWRAEGTVIAQVNAGTHSYMDPGDGGFLILVKSYYTGCMDRARHELDAPVDTPVRL